MKADEEALFEAASHLNNHAQREAFVQQACQGDSVLKDRLLALLDVHFSNASDEDLPQTNLAPTLEAQEETYEVSSTERPGLKIGRYKLLERLGEGGFGQVWAAEQTHPVKRRVALKIIKLGMDTKQVVARFEAERQALALMDHPNIAKVLDAGTTESGRPYFVMELVRGIPVTQYCDQVKLSMHPRLELFVKICQALQHAHQKGIIHRDIKPTNILVTLHDGEPVPKVIDFGIAKATQQELTDKTIYTQFQQFIGTPAYMSPEQAEMSGLDIDTRSDIYSLGVLLYQLLTGDTPFDAMELAQAGIEAMRKIIREKEPIKPSTKLSQTLTLHQGEKEFPLSRDSIASLQGDLDWIVMRCLEKDRTRRYESANGLALDIRRYLTNEPVLARPPSAIYKFSKAWRRNRVMVSSAMVVVVSLVLGISVSLWKTKEARDAQSRAETSSNEATRASLTANAEKVRAVKAEKLANQLKEAALKQASLDRRMAYASDMNEAHRQIEFGDLGSALNLLNRYRVTDDQNEDIRGWEWRYLRQQCQGDSLYDLGVIPYGTTGLRLDSSFDSRWLYVHSWRHEELPTFYDLKHRTKFKPSWIEPNEILTGFSPKDAFAIVQSKMEEMTKYTKVEMESGERKSVFGEFANVISSKLSGDGKIFVTLRKENSSQNKNEFSLLIDRWSISKEVRLSSVVIHGISGGLLARYGLPWNVDISYDGSQLAYYKYSGILQLFDASTGEELWNKEISQSPCFPGPFTPDGERLVCSVSLSQGGLLILDANTGDTLHSTEKHQSYITGKCLVNEGRTIVTCSADQTIRLWDIESGKALKTLKGHRAEIRGMVAIQGGKELVSGGFDGLLKVWDLEQDPEKNQHMVIPLPTFEPVKGVIPPVIDRWAFSADSQTIITMDNDANLIGISGRFFDRKSNIASLGEGIRGGAFSPDRLKFGSIDQDGDVFIWDLKTMHPEPQWVGQFDNSMPIGFRDKNQELVMLTQTPQNNEILLVHSKDGTIRSRIALKDKVVPHHLSQSGRWLFANVLSDGGNGQLFDLNHPEIESFNLSAASKNIGVYASSISPDDRFIITPAEPHLIRIFQIPARNPIKEMTAHLNGAKSIGFSPDSLRMVSGAAGRDAFKLWDVKTWRCLLTLPSDGQFWTRTQFSKDGNLIGSMGIDRESLHIWWAPSWDEIETMEQEVLNSRGNH